MNNEAGRKFEVDQRSTPQRPWASSFVSRTIFGLPKQQLAAAKNAVVGINVGCLANLRVVARLLFHLVEIARLGLHRQGCPPV
jgi:hypothetical protein